MESVQLTDFLAAIPNAHRLGLMGSYQQPGTGPLLVLPKLALPSSMIGQACYQRVMAEFPLIGLVISTAIVVATVVLNWSR